MVIDPNTARREWKIGRIECTYPGRDDLVKVIDVRVEDKVLRRPISRIPPPPWKSQAVVIKIAFVNTE